MSTPAGITEALQLWGSYPDDHPQTLADLREADPDTITHPLAWWLRHQTTDATNRSESHYITGLKDAFDCYHNKYVLHAWTKRWRAYALTANRQPMLNQHPGGTGYKVVTTRLLPKPDDLPALPPVKRSNANSTRQPGWLVLYGGDPDILTKEHVETGLAKLIRTRPVLDVLFTGPSDGAPTLYSLRNACGMNANDIGFDFPDGTSTHVTTLKGAF